MWNKLLREAACKKVVEQLGKRTNEKLPYLNKYIETRASDNGPGTPPSMAGTTSLDPIRPPYTLICSPLAVKGRWSLAFMRSQLDYVVAGIMLSPGKYLKGLM